MCSLVAGRNFVQAKSKLTLPHSETLERVFVWSFCTSIETGVPIGSSSVPQL